ncbi:MAG: MarR family transcriptional regulator [Geobacteraceae bacterium]|nr:MarR family transcriptional regulator [Geobacteraceae bacterium]
MPRQKDAQKPGACFCVNVRRAARAITKIYDQALEPSGLKVTQYSMLKNIDAYGPLNTSALAKLLSLDRTTLVRNLKLLESAGLIENRTSPDPRERQFIITEHGRQTVAHAMPFWKHTQRRLSQQIGTDNLALIGHLASVLEGLATGQDEPIA